MIRQQRRVGVADSLQPHDHVVWYGEEDADLYSLANTALADGARRREKLMFVAEGPNASRLQDVGDIDALMDRGQLVLADIRDVYGGSGSFNASDQLATFEGVLAEALADGYSGIRVVADNTPLAAGDEEAFDRWLAWEQVTDRFQSESNVTGICYFDRAALSEERLEDLASIHPVCHTHAPHPSFSFFIDTDAVCVTGTLDAISADQFTRVVGTTPGDRPLVLDLCETEFMDHRALLALNSAASARRPVRIRHARPIIRELPERLGIPTPHLCFE
jgi:anti-anti-sigma regulatory factor